MPLEEDERIVDGTLKGARECKMELAKRFDKVEDAIAYLLDKSTPLRERVLKRVKDIAANCKP